MLPDEAANAAVFRDCLKGAIGGLVSCCGTSDGDVVDVGDRVLGNLPHILLQKSSGGPTILVWGRQNATKIG